MKHYNFVLTLLSCFIVAMMISCGKDTMTYTISVTNSSDFKRKAETIEIPLEKVQDIPKEAYSKLVIIDNRDNKILSQLIDIDQDSIKDRIVFQADLGSNESKKFKLSIQKKIPLSEEVALRTFCRIVPERIDDFAWENDKVAFRTYGPKCQKLFEEGNSAGLISSGIDCWAKRVNYPIIDKWYEEFNNGKSYHEDQGEGLDAYHVGTARGCGGTAILQDDKYVLSENFVSWKVLANGPIRSVFELKYAPIEVSNSTIVERKRITIDLGTNLYHCKVSYNTKKQLDSAAIGLALHEGKGKTTSNIKEGWVSYWEPMRGSYIGTGILINSKSRTSLAINDTISKDESLNNIWINTKIKKNHFEYWSGFGWKKSGDFDSALDWENYLKKEAVKKRNPIQITITK